MNMNSDVQRKYLEINLYISCCYWKIWLGFQTVCESVYWSKKSSLVLTHIWLTANADSQTKGIHIF